MWNMYRIIYLIIVATLIVGAALAVYYLIYQHRINKKILSNESSGKKMADIPKAVMISVIILLLIYSAIIFESYQFAIKNAQEVSRNNYAVIDVSNVENYQYIEYFGSTEYADASFAEIYSKEGIPGYDREVIEDGNFTFITFTRNTPADSFHPDFLCFVDYNGTDENENFYKKGEFSTNIDGEEPFFGISSGGDSPSHMLYIGNLNQDDSFKITISLLDEDAEAQFAKDMQEAMEKNADSTDKFPVAEDYAIETGCVQIQLQ